MTREGGREDGSPPGGGRETRQTTETTEMGIASGTALLKKRKVVESAIKRASPLLSSKAAYIRLSTHES